MPASVDASKSLGKILVVESLELGERRLHGVPARGALAIGSAIEGDVHVLGHNIASRHLRLVFAPRGRVEIDVCSPYGVRLNGRLPRAGDLLGRGDVLRLGRWELSLSELDRPARDPVEDTFLEAFAHAPDDRDARLVYADWLEDRARGPEAELVRAATPTPELALCTDPAWRRRFLPVAIEGCDRAGSCPQSWEALPEGNDHDARRCAPCGRRVTFVSDMGTARARALLGRPFAIDPALPRHDGDLREPAKKRLAIDMGRPTRR